MIAREIIGTVTNSSRRQPPAPSISADSSISFGTSLNAAHVLARMLAVHGVPSALAPASELDMLVPEPGSVTVALSQSGETADVLRSLDGAYDRGPVLALTNVGTSTLGRSAHAVVELGVGPEIGVAATKTFTAQVVTGVSVLLSGLVHAGRISTAQAAALVDLMHEIPSSITEADALARSFCPAVASAITTASGGSCWRVGSRDTSASRISAVRPASRSASRTRRPDRRDLQGT